jgi:hypothetical protein
LQVFDGTMVPLKSNSGGQYIWDFNSKLKRELYK